MAGNITTVTHPDGTVSKRTSKTRTYTHAIQVSPADPRILAASMLRQADLNAAQAAKLRAAADAGVVFIKSRGFADSRPDSLHSHQAILKGTNREIFTWCSATGQTDTFPQPWPAPSVVGNVEQSLRADARKQADGLDAGAVSLRADAADILKAGVPVGSWSVERWSSRWDLADKALGTFAYLAERGHQVTVVPVDDPGTPEPTPAVEVPAPAPVELGVLARAAADAEYGRQRAEAIGNFLEYVEPAGTLQQRMAWRKANPDAVVFPVAGQRWEATCKGGPTCANWRSTGHLTEREAQVAYAIHRGGPHATGPRVQPDDIVTIHQGTGLRHVLEVDSGLDMVRVQPVDPEDTRDPWWVSLDLTHRATPVPVPWGQVLELPDGRRFAILPTDYDPLLMPTR